MYVICIVGNGFNSVQQRALRLLEKLDPSLCEELPQKQFATADYQWRNPLMPHLVDAINADVAKWVVPEPPYGYDADDVDDLELWKKRRGAALLWVKSVACHKFVVWLYKQYAAMFKEASSKQGRTNVTKCLEMFYTLRREREEGVIRVAIGDSLRPVAPTTTGESDIVDTFSFLVGVLLNAVFSFFGTQVRVRAPVKAQARYKDREDKVL